MKKTTFTTKQQLAKAYAPELKDGSAQRRLVRWLLHNPELMADLRSVGYRERQRRLTPAQVSVIFNHLGEP